MTNEEKRKQWRFYFALYFSDEKTRWEKGKAVIVASAGEFADLCVGEEEARFRDMRPEPEPVRPPLPVPSGPYRSSP